MNLKIAQFSPTPITIMIQLERNRIHWCFCFNSTCLTFPQIECSLLPTFSKQTTPISLLHTHRDKVTRETRETEKREGNDPGKQSWETVRSLHGMLKNQYINELKVALDLCCRDSKESFLCNIQVNICSITIIILISLEALPSDFILLKQGKMKLHITYCRFNINYLA